MQNYNAVNFVKRILRDIKIEELDTEIHEGRHRYLRDRKVECSIQHHHHRKLSYGECLQPL